MVSAKTPCQMKRDLLVDYLSSLEQLKVAQWEHKEILTIGIGNDGLALRSAQRIEAIKAQCRISRAKYTEHCRRTTARSSGLRADEPSHQKRTPAKVRELAGALGVTSKAPVLRS